MHIRSDRHHAVICTARNEKLRIALTKNERRPRARRALLEQCRCNLSRERFQRAKTWFMRDESCDDVETSMAQRFSRHHGSRARTQTECRPRKFSMPRRAPRHLVAMIRAVQNFFAELAPEARANAKTRRTRANQRQGDSRPPPSRWRRQPACADILERDHDDDSPRLTRAAMSRRRNARWRDGARTMLTQIRRAHEPHHDGDRHLAEGCAAILAGGSNVVAGLSPRATHARR
jgi:hypothetical protein